MKIKSVRIEGMHNVADKTYTFKDLTYLIGKNGAGKSTVLEAIQLGLLGYIPGYAKTGEGIFKHARGKTMSVTLSLDNEGSPVTITRSWISAGSSVKTVSNIDPASFDISNILRDIELPIFNFNDFTGLTANKLKEWFISFLPPAETAINWEEELNSATADRALLDPELIPSVLAHIADSDSHGVELVKEVNSYLKETQSYLTGRLKSLQGTVDSLVYYDDFTGDIDDESISAEIERLTELRKELAAYNAVASQVARIQTELATIHVDGESFTADPTRSKYDKILIDADSAIAEIAESIEDNRKKLNDIDGEIRSLSTLAASTNVCPYTKTACDSVVPAIKKAKQRCEDLMHDRKDIESALATLVSGQQAEIAKKADAQKQLDALKSTYSKFEYLTSQLKEVPCKPTELADAELAEQISNLHITLQKSAANKKYNQLVETVTKEKYVIENSIEIYKLLVKLTDANGLQTKLMNEPFDRLTEDMSEYLSEMFGKPSVAKFNLAEKANSFNFGLIRDDKYITFDTLSSGEKCLYTLALMMCIVNRSESPLNLIIVDDLLDHLDSDNAAFLFDSLNHVKDVQIIMAGVQSCPISDIMIEVG